jgi:hypothetical protein
MRFLDASILVEGCLQNSSKFAAADALIKSGSCTSSHALAEAYTTLSGDKRLRINPHHAAEMVLDCARKLKVISLSPFEMLTLITQAPQLALRAVLFTMPSMRPPHANSDVPSSSHSICLTSATLPLI